MNLYKQISYIQRYKVTEEVSLSTYNSTLSIKNAFCHSLKIAVTLAADAEDPVIDLT